MSKKRVLLIVPHEINSPGVTVNIPVAYRALWRLGSKTNEYKIGECVLTIAKRHLEERNFSVWLDDRNDGFRAIQKRAANHWNNGIVTSDFVDLSLEFHCNSASRKTATGLEILSQNEDLQTHIFAARLASHWAAAYGLAKRHSNGVKILDDSERGDWNLSSIEKISKHEILTELFFESNESDVEKVFSKGPEFLGKVIADGVCAFFNIRMSQVTPVTVNVICDNCDDRKKLNSLRLQHAALVASHNNLKTNIRNLLV